MAKNNFTDYAGYCDYYTSNDYANSPIGDHIMNVEYDLSKRKTGYVSMDG